MKKLYKKIFLGFFCLTFILATIFVGFVYLMDSPLKANYYLKIALDLDEHHPYGSREAVKYYKKAIKTFKKSDNEHLAVEAYINLGLLHYKFGNILQVERMVLKALSVGKKEIPQSMEAKVYLLLASTVEPKKAKKYIAKSLDISKRLKFNTLIAEAYFLLGKTNEYKAEFEEAESNYLKAVEAVHSFANIDGFFDAGQLYERLGELYAGGGNTDKAIEFYYEALSYNLREERSFVTANYMKVIGDLYEEKHNMVKACELWGQSKDEYAFFGAQAPFSISSNQMLRPCDNFG